MKLKITLIVCIFALSILSQSTSVNAQGSVSFGPKGGFTVTSFTGNNAGTVSAKSMWVGGAFVNLHILGFFAIQPELLVHQKGATHIENNVKDEISVNYFEVPVLFKLLIPIDGHVYPHVFAGPSVGYAMSSTFTSTNVSDGKQLTANVGDISKTDIGGVVGAGLDYETDHLFFNVDGRYGAGFSTLGSSSNLNFKNNNFTFMVGVGLRFGSSK
jgi:hypothetical protein